MKHKILLTTIILIGNTSLYSDWGVTGSRNEMRNGKFVNEPDPKFATVSGLGKIETPAGLTLYNQQMQAWILFQNTLKKDAVAWKTYTSSLYKGANTKNTPSTEGIVVINPLGTGDLASDSAQSANRCLINEKNQVVCRPHKGTDLRAAKGSMVVSAGSGIGVVHTASEHHAADGYGSYVIVENAREGVSGKNYFLLYGHTYRVNGLKKNSKVNQGEIISYVNDRIMNQGGVNWRNGARTKGLPAHLHFEIKLHPEIGKNVPFTDYVNPYFALQSAQASQQWFIDNIWNDKAALAALNNKTLSVAQIQEKLKKKKAINFDSTVGGQALARGPNQNAGPNHDALTLENITTKLANTGKKVMSSTMSFVEKLFTPVSRTYVKPDWYAERDAIRAQKVESDKAHSEKSNPQPNKSAPAIGKSAPAIGKSAPAIGKSAPAIGKSAPAVGKNTEPSLQTEKRTVSDQKLSTLKNNIKSEETSTSQVIIDGLAPNLTSEQLKYQSLQTKLSEPLFASAIKTMNEPNVSPEISLILKKFRLKEQNKYFMPFSESFDRSVTELIKTEAGDNSTNEYKTVRAASPSINFKQTAGVYKPFGFGCEGITYNGAIEQIPIDYLSNIKNSFKKVTDRYVDCNAEGSDAKLMQQANDFANGMCALEMVEYTMSGKLDGAKLIGTNFIKAYNNCKSILTGIGATKIALNLNEVTLAKLSGAVSLDLAKVPEYIACVGKEIEDMDIVALYDDCYDRRFNFFMKFMNELFNLEFSVNLGVKGLQTKACQYELEKNGNVFESVNGKWNILNNTLNSDFGDEALEPVENLNGIIIDRQRQEFRIGQDLTEEQTTKLLGTQKIADLLETYIRTAYLATAPSISEKPDCITKQADAFADELLRQVGGPDGDYFDVSALISYINEPIYLITDITPIPVAVPYIVPNTCATAKDIKMSYELHLRLQTALIKFLNLYFTVLNDSAIIKAKKHGGNKDEQRADERLDLNINVMWDRVEHGAYEANKWHCEKDGGYKYMSQWRANGEEQVEWARCEELPAEKEDVDEKKEEEKGPADIFDVKYLGNDTTGILNARIEEFNMMKVKERSAQFKRAAITKSIFFTKKFERKHPFSLTWGSECSGD